MRTTPAGLVRFFNPGQEDLRVGTVVVIEDEDGRHEATVVVAPSQLMYSDIRGELAPILGVSDTERGRES